VIRRPGPTATPTKVYLANHATAKVLFDASSGSNHMDLKGITVS